ncbi:terminase small subunit [Francisella sp. SYW-9]|uniref:terminase small subunit n=1 Tax=Francisella sp. SYW-9 TaxID=2610888 RepID=UPI00123D6DDB|nr:terminase small subunit [Francisella sp. SYW-9]
MGLINSHDLHSGWKFEIEGSMTISTDKGLIVNKQELANTFGVDVTTVDKWIRNGCPYVEKGSKGVAWQYNTADVIKWRRDRDVEYATKDTFDVTSDVKELDINIKQEKLRLTKYQADEQKVKAERAERKLIPIEDVQLVLGDLFVIMKDKLLNIPERVEIELLGETDAKKFNKVLLREVKDAIDSILNGESIIIDQILEKSDEE